MAQLIDECAAMAEAATNNAALVSYSSPILLRRQSGFLGLALPPGFYASKLACCTLALKRADYS